jgi:hypothetical protein
MADSKSPKLSVSEHYDVWSGSYRTFGATQAGCLVIASVSVPQLSPCPFVGSAFRPRHEQAILLERRNLELALASNRVVLEIARLRFGRGTTTCRNCGDLERIEQSIADDFDSIPHLHACARCGAFAVELHMAAGYGRSRPAARLEKSAEEQPAVDA